MPKVSSASAHFDVPALCEAVLEQDIGFNISTNNPAGFQRIMYKHMREHPEHRFSIFADPRSPERFFLTKREPQE